MTGGGSVRGLREDLATVSVLWRRDLRLFLRQRSRLLGTLAQPLLFWLALGSGMSPTFRLTGGGPGYLAYFFPGVVLMLVLLSAISSTMSVIEDRHQGFLQGVLVAPGSRAALVAGKSLGSSTIAMIQACLFLLLAPLAGLPLGGVSWVLLAIVLTLTCLGLTAQGFALAWWLDSSHAYHVVMSVVLIPQWVLSGAVFPAEGLNPVLRAIVRFNPMSYAVAGMRRAMHGGTPPAGTAIHAGGAGLEITVVAALAAVSLAAATAACARRR